MEKTSSVADFVFTQDDERQGRLVGTVRFPEPTKLLLFGWYENDLHWSKVSAAETEFDLSLFYHICRGPVRQLIFYTSYTWLEKVDLTDLEEPSGDLSAEVRSIGPSVLYSKGKHGVGIFAIPQQLTQSMRNGIWKAKPEAGFEDSGFAVALTKGRQGLISSHYFNQ